MGCVDGFVPTTRGAFAMVTANRPVLGRSRPRSSNRAGGFGLANGLHRGRRIKMKRNQSFVNRTIGKFRDGDPRMAVPRSDSLVVEFPAYPSLCRCCRTQRACISARCPCQPKFLPFRLFRFVEPYASQSYLVVVGDTKVQRRLLVISTANPEVLDVFLDLRHPCEGLDPDPRLQPVKVNKAEKGI